MSDFLDIIDVELDAQKTLAKKSKKALKKCPVGFLISKCRKNKSTFYQKRKSDGRYQEFNLSDQEELIRKLLEKKVNEKALAAAENNLELLVRLKAQYQPNAFTDIMGSLSKSYYNAVTALGYAQTLDKQTGKPIQYHYEEKKHIHETICGLMVRSKSEVIVTNALTSYGIPFSYEKNFPRYEDDLHPLEPDFTFELPDGNVKLWEHLGMLSLMNYCDHNAYKLFWYQKLGFHIGRNLIITQDDHKGNCSSPYIDKMIRQHLLPYYR